MSKTGVKVEHSDDVLSCGLCYIGAGMGLLLRPKAICVNRTV